MFGPLGHQGVGVFLVESGAGARGLSDRQGGRDLTVAGAHVHVLHGRHLHGLLPLPTAARRQQALSTCHRGPARPADPPGKLHRTGEKQGVSSGSAWRKHHTTPLHSDSASNWKGRNVCLCVCVCGFIMENQALYDDEHRCVYSCSGPKDVQCQVWLCLNELFATYIYK